MNCFCNIYNERISGKFMKEIAKQVLTLIEQGKAYTIFPAQKEGNVIRLGGVLYDNNFYVLVNKIGPDYEYVNHIEAVLQKQIDELTLSEIATYLTWLVRKERFCESFLAEYIDNLLLPYKHYCKIYRNYVFSK